MTLAKAFILLIWRRRIVAVSWVCGWMTIYAAFAEPTEPPQFNTRTWQTDDGLPQNTVQAVAQGLEGYIWVGTLRGLARFDGVRFKVLDSDNTPALKIPSITALCQGRDGSLWIGTGGGGLLEKRGDQFVSHPLGETIRANTVKCITESRDGSLWVGTVEGLFHYQSGKLTRFTTKDGLVDDVVRSVYEDGNQLWIGAGFGVHIYKDGAITRPAMPAEFPSTTVHAILRDRKGVIWVAVSGGLASIENGKISIFSKKDGLPDDNVTTIFEDRRGNLWIGTSGGLCRMTRGKFVIEKERAGGFYDQVNALFEDQEGDIWVSARDGLHQLRARRFLAYARPQGLPHNNIMSILEDRAGSLWMGTWGGGLVQMKNGEITNYTRENNLGNGLSTDLILSLFGDQDGSILIGTDYEGGTFRYNKGRFDPVWGRKDPLTNRVVRVIYRDHAGNLWFGASPGLVLDASHAKYLEHATIRCITDDGDGTLWVGSNDGLFRRRNGKFERLSLPGNLEHATIIALYADKDNTLWVGTEKGGLGRWKDGHYTAYTSRSGLWSDEIFEILEDDQGWLWMSCTHGVFRVSKANLAEFDRKEKPAITCIAYGKADGMESIQCNGVSKPAAWKTRDGRLWFATTKGVVVTDPGVGKGFNEIAPAVRIEEVLADRKAASAGGEAPGKVRVAPGRGELEFHYTALSFVVPEKNRFRYKLAGVDQSWVDAGNRRVAYYNNLRPGEYEFQVVAANNDGIWNLKGATVTVKLLPHFWQSWWFTACAVAAMAGIVGGVVRKSTRGKLQRKVQLLEQQHAIESERTRIARDMHDDLGARLTEILLLNELAQKSNANPENFLTHLDKQSQVIQDVAGSLDAIVWAVNPVNDSLDRLANYLYAQSERLLGMRFIHCRFDVPDELPVCSLSSDVRHNVYLAVRETLNNIVKHSGASEVWFRLRTTPTTLSIVIEDNGGGFSPEDRASAGNGLHNIEKRMKNLGGSFQLTTRPGDGTRIRLEVPIKAETSI
jgi:ligand-binding sensor domain-containing protein/signal transduction histidine kinase